ncbi:helix-turn-helix transcriptional regulator [uncultured Shimia sp.]|uniref:helix-turn-helix transcriptional regulator n=1 Tax=uncultured Shimia sp. TaxID=573152 RepID=UPI00261AF55C|nr:helix-turn-helix transcriptional regulator [uncultured Shimia sp.]
MVQQTLAGSRIRERRVMAGLRQAELARQVGISGSYLNLIEHNRRRIGGKLLNDIAQALDVEPSLLSEGAEAALLSALRVAAAEVETVAVELERGDEFAGRFPGWAALISEQHKRLRSLEHTAATLTDRLTHDPHLATSVHEMLTMVTAIRSTAGILADTKEIEPEWRNRFHRNLNEDSQRLAEGAEQLVAYLDDAGDASAGLTLPLEEVEAMLAAHKFRFDSLVDATPDALSEFVGNQSQLTSDAARDMAMTVVRQLRADARLLSLEMLERQVNDGVVEPAQIASDYGVPLSTVLRRLAAVSDDMLPMPLGLVMCDASGTLMLRKPVEGFAIPRFSGACPKWPLFQALSRPMQALRQTVTMTGREAKRFDCYAVSEPIGTIQVNVAPLYHSYMLIVPLEEAGEAEAEVGSSCRVCPLAQCEGRREPSLLADVG